MGGDPWKQMFLRCGKKAQPPICKTKRRRGVPVRYYENVVFPTQAGAVIDVTKAPYCLDPTGREDCTEKLRRLLDDLLRGMVSEMKEVYERLREAPDNTWLSPENRKVNNRVNAIFPCTIDQIPMLYFPNGTYLVSDTVSYTLRDLHNMMYHYTSGGFELNRCIRMIGQSRDGTVIKLKDHCKGFEYGQERPVINFMLGERSNVSMSNYFENMTVDVGKGNPGAVGLVFFANNSGAVRNVTIRSSDENRDGAIGFLIRGEFHSACNVYSMRIEGFRYGMLVSSYRTFAHFEDITLCGQTKYGIKIDNNAVQIIGLKASVDVPAVYLAGPMAHVVLTDAEIVSKGTEYPAIKYELGCIYLRNIRTNGFQAAYDQNWFAWTIPDGYIAEYCSGQTRSLFGGEARGVGLQVPPLPDVALEQDPDKWCCVNEFGAVGDGVHDDTEAISAALCSGSEVIWFQPGRYLITRPVDIPGTVKHIHYMYCDICAGEELRTRDGEAVFRISGDSDSVLLLEKLFSWNECTGRIRMFRHDSRRTVYMRDMHTQACALYFNTVPGAELFFENCACTIGKKQLYSDIPAMEFNGQTVWCHAINPERSMAETVNRGGTLWWSGFKSEQEGSINITTDGGTTEILGGVAVSGHGKDNPLIVNRDSTVSAIFATTGYDENATFPVAVLEQRGESIRVIRDRELPSRCPPWYFMPLYAGFRGE